MASDIKSKVTQATTGVFASVEGVMQLILDESVIGYIAQSSDPAAGLVALVVFLAGAMALISAGKLDEGLGR